MPLRGVREAQVRVRTRSASSSARFGASAGPGTSCRRGGAQSHRPLSYPVRSPAWRPVRDPCPIRHWARRSARRGPVHEAACFSPACVRPHAGPACLPGLPARKAAPSFQEGRAFLHSAAQGVARAMAPSGRTGIVASIGTGSTPDGRRNGSAPEPPGSGSGKRRADGVAQSVPRPACFVQRCHRRFSCVLSGENSGTIVPSRGAERAFPAAGRDRRCCTASSASPPREELRREDRMGLDSGGRGSGGGSRQGGPGKGVDNVFLIRACMGLR